MSINGPDEAFKAQVRIWLRHMSAWNLGGRPAAIQRLREMGPQVVDVLQDILQEETLAAKRKVPGKRVMLFALVLAIVFCFKGAFRIGSLPFLSLFEMLSLLTMGSCGILMMHRMALGQQEVIAALAELNDPRSTRFFIAALRTGDLRTKLKAGDALTHVLPYLSGADAASVPSQDRMVLYNLLLSDDRALKLSILSAIPAFDDFLALPMVENLASDARIRNSDPEVYNMAQAALPVLTTRRDAAAMAGTLLRASSAASSFSQTSLRAAIIGNNPNPDLLLRAVIKDETKS